MLSAMGDDSNRIKGLGLGADDYLPKPLTQRTCCPHRGAKKKVEFIGKEGNFPTNWVINDVNIKFE